jgi:hypothetical protein
MKLSKAQLAVLQEAVGKGKVTAVDWYQPVQKRKPRGPGEAMKTIQLKTLARLINEQYGPAYYATCEPWTTSTDFKPKGCRYITRKGKGRKGFRLQVYGPTLPGELRRPVVIDHNSSEPYRTNREAMEKVAALFGMIWDPKRGPAGKVVWRYSCDGRDERHGCYDADFDGVCSAYYGSKRTYTTKEACQAKAYKHERECHFRGKTTVRGVLIVDPDPK